MKIKLNEDSEHVEAIKKKLKENFGFCPCSVVKDENSKCMCKTFREQSEGYCHCGLYRKIKIEENVNVIYR